MGSALSFFHLDNTATTAAMGQRPGLGDLPESCVASVLVYMDPPEICRLARLNRAFRGASSADFVWESKLPPNYEALMKRVFENGENKDYSSRDLCKRDVYSRLCRHNSFDGGTKRAWLDKKTGRVCLSIASSGLVITGIDDRRYWSRIQTEESRFSSVAYLQQIWWFEVDGEVEFPLPEGSYSLFFRLQLGRASKRFGRRICNTDQVHGWDIKPVRFQLSTSEGQQATSQCYLKEPGKWTFYHAGDFVVADSSAPTKIKFSMTQIDCTHPKGGLCVDSVLVYPASYPTCQIFLTKWRILKNSPNKGLLKNVDDDAKFSKSPKEKDNSIARSDQQLKSCDRPLVVFTKCTAPLCNTFCKSVDCINGSCVDQKHCCCRCY